MTFMARSRGEAWLAPDRLALVQSWARDGLLDQDIARRMGVDPSTLRRWRDRYPALNQALCQAQDLDSQVEGALLRRALGYSVTEVKRVDNGKDAVSVTETVKHVPPDTTALFFWLKNRQPQRWDARAAGDAPEVDALVRVYLPDNGRGWAAAPAEAAPALSAPDEPEEP